MSGLLNFLESAATAGADMMESDRKIEAERIKQEALERMRHSNNMVLADLKHGYAMDEVASRQDREDTRTQAKIAAEIEAAELLNQQKIEAAAQKTHEERQSYDSEQTEVYDPDLGRNIVTTRGDAKRGLLYTGDDVAAMDEVEGPVQPTGNTPYGAKKTDKTSKASIVYDSKGFAYQDGQPVVVQGANGTVHLQNSSKGQEDGSRKVGGWDQKAASKYFTSQAWKAVGKGVDEYGMPIGEVTAADRNRARQMAADALAQWQATEGKTDPVAIANIVFEKMAVHPVKPEAPSDKPEQRYIDEATSMLNEQETGEGLIGSGSNFFDAYDAEGEREDVMSLAWELQDKALGKSPEAPASPPNEAAILDQARDAIAKGADAEKVKERLLAAGIDPSQL